MSNTVSAHLSVAQDITTLIEPYCSKVELVGSLRRGLDFSDPRTQENIDILIIPQAELFPFISFQHYKKVISNLTGVEFFPYTQWFALMTFVRENIKIRLFTATMQDFGVAKLIFTGSNKFNLTPIDRAKSLGLLFNTDSKGVWGIWDQNGKLLTDGTEESVFKALGIQYILPKDRSLFEKDSTILRLLS